MNGWIGDTTGIEQWLSVMGQLFAVATPLRQDRDPFDTFIDALLGLLHPYATGRILADKLAAYDNMPDQRTGLIEAVRSGTVQRLTFEMQDPDMPREYQGVVYNGPHVTIFMGAIDTRDVVGVTLSLTPLLSPFQAGIAAQLPTFFTEWIPRLNAYEAFIRGGSEWNDTRQVIDYFNYAIAPADDPRLQSSDFFTALTGRAVVLPVTGTYSDEQPAKLPIRLLPDARYREEDGFIISCNDSDPTGALTFNLHFERDLTAEEYDALWVAINGWEIEFYSRFDDDWGSLSSPNGNLKVARWRVLATQVFSAGDPTDETSGNGVNERALRELQQWLLLLPEAQVHELVIGKEAIKWGET